MGSERPCCDCNRQMSAREWRSYRPEFPPRLRRCDVCTVRGESLDALAAERAAHARTLARLDSARAEADAMVEADAALRAEIVWRLPAIQARGRLSDLTPESTTMALVAGVAALADTDSELCEAERAAHAVTAARLADALRPRDVFAPDHAAQSALRAEIAALSNALADERRGRAVDVARLTGERDEALADFDAERRTVAAGVAEVRRLLAERDALAAEVAALRAAPTQASAAADRVMAPVTGADPYAPEVAVGDLVDAVRRAECIGVATPAPDPPDCAACPVRAAAAVVITADDVARGPLGVHDSLGERLYALHRMICVLRAALAQPAPAREPAPPCAACADGVCRLHATGVDHCDAFDLRPDTPDPMAFNGSCETDGHYLCAYCTLRKPRHPKCHDFVDHADSTHTDGDCAGDGHEMCGRCALRRIDAPAREPADTAAETEGTDEQ